jgi:outer membrane receptor protein involved in Fe transport
MFQKPFILRAWLHFVLLSFSVQLQAGAPDPAKDTKAVLPPVIVPEESHWHLSAGPLWRQMNGLSQRLTVNTDVGDFFGSDQDSLDGFGAFVMLESPALIQRGPSALTLSIMYSWASMDDLNRASQLGGRPSWQDFSLDLHTVSIGPRYVYETPRLRLSTSAGFAMNWARWQQEFRLSSIPPGSIRVARSGVQHTYLPGLYVDAMAQLRLSERWFLLTGGRYDWARSMDSSLILPTGNSSSVHANLDGWTMFAGLTYRF